MEISAKQLAALLNGTVEGNPDVKVNRPAKIEEGTAGTLTFLANPKYESFIYQTKASIVLVSKTFKPSQAIDSTLVRVDDVYSCISFLLEKFGETQKPTTQSISEKSSIHPSVKIGENAQIGDFTIIEENAQIGDDCVLYPQVFIGKSVKIGKNVTLFAGVKIYKECVIGDNCILHANTVIGSDGFGFAPQSDGTYKKVPQIGNVIVGNNVEIGANSTIDRATMGSTLIKDGVKLDNLVQIAHNVEIGENTVIAAQTGVAGSTKIGKNCMIGGQVGIAGHLSIADFTKIQGQSGIGGNIVETNTAWYGTPAIDYKNYIRSYVLFKNLPELEKRVKNLEKKKEE